MSDSRLTTGTQIGDYLLKDLLYEGAAVRTWLAQQVSVQRDVIIDSLNRSLHSDEMAVNNFIADIRAKARLDHPLIGSVFEAIQEDQVFAYAREQLHGHTLEEFVESRVDIPPKDVAHILRQIAEANLYLEKNNIASLPIQPHQIYFGDKYLTRMVNMAIGGERDHQISAQDKVMLAHTFLGLLRPGEPGATRTTSLLTHMADEEREIPITWGQIKELAENIEQQLSGSVFNASSGHLDSVSTGSQQMHPAARVGIILAAVLAIGGLLFFITQSDQGKSTQARETNRMVHIPAGQYATHDGGKTKTTAFLIDAHEVSIAEYKVFLDFLSTAKELGTETNFDSPEQPAEKNNHIPEDWEAMYKAARNHEIWTYRGESSPVKLRLDLNSPVINIDWYDAYAYAEWKHHRLPTQEEWHAALTSSSTLPDSLIPASYGPVDQAGDDITENQIYGLAGNVTEWTSDNGRNPAFPAMPKRPILCGGSYLRNQRHGATAREWVESRMERRPDLGFRTVKDPTPN